MQFAAKVKPEQPCTGYIDNYMPTTSCHEPSSPVVTAFNSQTLGKSVFTKDGNAFALQTAAALQKLRANSSCGFNGMQLQQQQQQQQAFAFRVPSNSNPAPIVGEQHTFLLVEMLDQPHHSFDAHSIYLYAKLPTRETHRETGLSTQNNPRKQYFNT